MCVILWEDMVVLSTFDLRWEFGLWVNYSKVLSGIGVCEVQGNAEYLDESKGESHKPYHLM